MTFTPTLAASLEELCSKFGLHTDAFIAHGIAFVILVFIVVKFGIKPIQAQLEERRKRIEEGEAMRAESEKALADVKDTSAAMIEEAREKAEAQLADTKQMADRLQEESAAKAAAEARQVLDNARQQAELEARQQQEELRGDFARLVALATSQVTGKVLSENDHRAINEEAIKQL